MRKKILVTGGGGYIGSIVVPYLIKSGYKVVVYDRFFFGNFLPKNNSNLIIKQKDVRELDLKDFERIYAVVDLVGISNDPSGEFFKRETNEINFKSRVLTAKLAKKMSVKRYILPSSCSIYGSQKKKVTEKSKVNPLTAYAKANLKAEKKVLALSDDNFCVTVIRQATVFGYSPRMRFDLAINGMTEGITKNNKLPLMRDGSQVRPLVHVKDIARFMKFIIEKDVSQINNQIFNLGSEKCTKSVKEIGKEVRKAFSKKVLLSWYGDPDRRTYDVSFSKIEKIGFKVKYDISYGVKELKSKIERKKISKDKNTITLEWYKYLEEMNLLVNKLSINKKMVKF